MIGIVISVANDLLSTSCRFLQFSHVLIKNLNVTNHVYQRRRSFLRMTLDWIFSSNMPFGYNVPLRQGRFYVETIFDIDGLPWLKMKREDWQISLLVETCIWVFTQHVVEEFTFSGTKLQVDLTSKPPSHRYQNDL